MANKPLSGKALVIQIDRQSIHIAQTVLGASWPQLEDREVLETPYGAVDDGQLVNPDMIRSVLAPVLESPALSRTRPRGNSSIPT